MKKFYFLTMIFALLCIGQVWGNEAPSNSLKSSRSWTGSHATFTLSGDNGNGTNDCVGVKGGQDIYVNWTVDEGCTINVTAIRMKVGHSRMVHGGWTCEISINDEYKWGVGTSADFRQTADGYNLHNDDNFKLSFSTNADLYWVTITYTITPNDAPAVAEPASVAIPVSLSDDRKNVDLSQVFTLAAGVPSDFAIEYNKDGGVIDGSNFYAEAVGEYTLKARVAAKENDHEVSAWSGDYVITVERRNSTLTLTTNETAVQVEKTLDLSALIAEHIGDALEYSVTSANKDKATLNGAEFSATEAGEYTVLIKSKESDQYNETSQIVTVTVNAKPTPSFVRNFTQEEADALLVEGTIAEAFTLTNVSADANLAVNIVTTKIDDIKKGDAVLSYDKASNTLTALNAGTATLQFVQTETEEIGGASSEVFTFTVSKHDNTLYVKGVADFAATIQPDAVLEDVVFTADNTDYANSPINWAVKEGAEFAEFDEVNNIITANYKLGTASWTLTQEESYKYKAANATFSVTVKLSEEAVCNVYENATGTSCSSWGESDHLTWEDGAVAKLQFEADKNMSTAVGGLGVFCYKDEKWEEKFSIDVSDLDKDKYKSFEFDLEEGVTGIYFKSGSYTRNIRNIVVTRKTFLRAEDVVLNLLPEQDGEGVLTVNYSLADGDELTIKSDNDLFTLDQNTIAYGNCTSGKVEIPVHFAAKAELGIYKTNVTIYNAYYSKTVQLIANVKYTPVITWDDINLAYGEDSLLAAEVDIDTLAINYELVDENTDVISLVDGMIVAEKPGTAQVRAFTAATAQYKAAEQIINVIVSKASQEIVWGMEADTILLEVNTERLVAVTATSGLDVEVTTSADSIVEVLENSYDEYGAFIGVFLKALLEGEATITASQPGDEYYEAAEQSWKIVVVKTCITGFEDLFVDKQTVKVIRNGQVYILRDGNVYSITGMRVE